MKPTLSTAYSTPTDQEVIQLYERMRIEGLLAYVVQGRESLEEFMEITAYPTFQLVREVPDDKSAGGGQTSNNPIAGFWWLSPVYGAACAFHFCLFRPYRAQAASLFRELSARIFASGFSAIFAFSNTRRRDLTRFCRSVGFKHIETINNINQEELNVWVAQPAAYSKTF